VASDPPPAAVGRPAPLFSPTSVQGEPAARRPHLVRP